MRIVARGTAYGGEIVVMFHRVGNASTPAGGRYWCSGISRVAEHAWRVTIDPLHADVDHRYLVAVLCAERDASRVFEVVRSRVLTNTTRLIAAISGLVLAVSREARARRGLRAGDAVYAPGQVTVGHGSESQAIRIAVVPARWPLPRSFRFATRRGRRFLQVDPPTPPESADTVERVGPNDWRATLRWSKEALDAAGYGITFWFMKKVGEALYTDGVPRVWEPMTPAEAGQNAAKQTQRRRSARNALAPRLGRDPGGRQDQEWVPDRAVTVK